MDWRVKALVTGSTGFIGSHLCRALLENGNQVVAFRRKASPLTLIKNLPVEHHIGDITDIKSIESAMQKVDLVYHAAAQLGSATRRQTNLVTVVGTRNLLQAAMNAGVQRVVHTSSVAALGVPTSTDENILLHECHTWNYPAGWWQYGYAKYLAELEVQCAVASGLDAVIVNPTLVIGAGDINKIAGAVLLRVADGRLNAATQGGLNAIHIKDVIHGHLLAASHGKTGHRYILGSVNMTHLEFLTEVASVARVRPPRFIVPAGFLRKLAPLFSVLAAFVALPFSPDAARKVGYHFYYDTTKAFKDLGFTPHRSIEGAIAESLNWYKERNSMG
jgi:dihydroflavonol-4-reductase